MRRERSLLIKPVLLFLSNPENDGVDEDRLLVKCLAASFEIVVSHPLSIGGKLKHADLVVIRNIWPVHEYQSEWNIVRRKLQASGIPIFNDLNGQADAKGKRYLVKLFSQGFPVVPSISERKQLNRLPPADAYIVKPLFGCDGFGLRSLTQKELVKEWPHGCIVQPKVDFREELMFYYLDRKFVYALRTRDKLRSSVIKPFKPDKKTLAVISRFVRWNSLHRGIQRIDAFRLKDGSMLVNEVEDFCPYLWLEVLSEKEARKIITAIEESLKRMLKEKKGLAI